MSEVEMSLMKLGGEWKKAPLHVRTMAGPLILPIFEVLNAVGAELASLNHQIDQLKIELRAKK